MNKIIAEDLYSESPDKFKVFREWGAVNASVTKFLYNATPKTFIFLFGEDEGMRLWGHFCNDCNRKDFTLFKTYLSSTQFNDLLVNIHYNELIFCL